VRVKLGNDLSFRSQKAEVVLTNESSFVLLILKPTGAFNIRNGEWAARALVVHLMKVRLKVADARPREKSLDFRPILWRILPPVCFPLLKVHDATRVRRMKMVIGQVSNELLRVGSDSTTDRTYHADCDPIRRSAFDQEAF
jgi:hypothetical protein